jgi:hypothetical protein
MNRLFLALSLLCSVSLGIGCNGEAVRTPTGPTEVTGGNPPPPPPPPRDVKWSLAATLTSVTGCASANWSPILGYVESHTLFIRQSGTTIRLFANNNGFQLLPEGPWEAELVERDFTAVAHVGAATTSSARMER